MRHSVPPATEETSTARARQRGDSILPRLTSADPTTIAMLQESYLFWRIKKGGVGLPIEGMPWKSAMPRWELELPDEWIWKIIMGEYDGAHQSPRTWE